MDLQSMINSQPSDGRLELPPGEFFGQIVIDRRITVVGQGKGTWIGSRTSPTIRITSPGVKLRNLMIESTEGPNTIAIYAAPGANPELEDVIVRGRTEGIRKDDIHFTQDVPRDEAVRISFAPPPPAPTAATPSGFEREVKPPGRRDTLTASPIAASPKETRLSHPIKVLAIASGIAVVAAVVVALFLTGVLQRGKDTKVSKKSVPSPVVSVPKRQAIPMSLTRAKPTRIAEPKPPAVPTPVTEEPSELENLKQRDEAGDGEAQFRAGLKLAKDIVAEARKIKNKKNAFNIKLTVAGNKKTFAVGEPVSFILESDRDCHVNLIDVGATGKVYRIFPNKWHKTKKVKKGKTYTIPPKKGSYRFTIRGPQGTEYVKAIAATIPLKSVAKAEMAAKGGAFEIKKPKQLLKDIGAELAKRQGKTWAEAEVSFKIVAPRPIASPNASSDFMEQLRKLYKRQEKFLVMAGPQLFGDLKSVYLDKIGRNKIRNAAERGDSLAQSHLGLIYRFGIGFGGSRDIKEAEKWSRRAAKQGNPLGQYLLAIMYMEGKVGPVNLKEGVRLLRKAAEQGFSPGQFMLGRQYSTGQGVPKDKKKAVKWCRKAAEQGIFFAQQELASMYRDGEGVPKNKKEAEKWFRKAAESRKELAEMYD